MTKEIHPDDKMYFHYKDELYDERSFMRNALLGGKKFILREPVDEENEFKHTNK